MTNAPKIEKEWFRHTKLAMESSYLCTYVQGLVSHFEKYFLSSAFYFSSVTTTTITITTMMLRLVGQGCQMVCFQTENSNLGKSWRAFEWSM
jgi:hypothetical protein